MISVEFFECVAVVNQIYVLPLLRDFFMSETKFPSLKILILPISTPDISLHDKCRSNGVALAWAPMLYYSYQFLYCKMEFIFQGEQ